MKPAIKPDLSNVIWMNADDVPDDVLEAAPIADADMTVALLNGARTAGNFLYDHRQTIKNVAVGTVVVVGAIYGPTIVLGAWAQAAHSFREIWHGRGYSDRWNNTNGES